MLFERVCHPGYNERRADAEGTAGLVEVPVEPCGRQTTVSKAPVEPPVGRQPDCGKQGVTRVARSVTARFEPTMSLPPDGWRP